MAADLKTTHDYRGVDDRFAPKTGRSEVFADYPEADICPW